MDQLVCPSGHPTPEQDARFCPTCGSPLVPPLRVPAPGEALPGGLSQPAPAPPRRSRKRVIIGGSVAAVLLVGLAAGIITSQRGRDGEGDGAPIAPPLSDAEIGKQNCMQDFAWAVDQLDAGGEQLVINEWGLADGRFKQAAAFYTQYAEARANYGRETAAAQVLVAIGEWCSSTD